VGWFIGPLSADPPYRSSAVAKKRRANDWDLEGINDQDDRAADEHDQRERKEQPAV
jgi:hypothetical protein